MRPDRWMFLGISFALTCGAGAAWAITPEDKCEADKNKIAGKYAFCRQKAEATAIKKGESADYSKCDAKLSDKWGKAEQKAIDKGTSCIDSLSVLDVQSFVAAHTDVMAAGLDGGALPECGDNAINAVGEQCDGSDLGGDSCVSLGFTGGTLSCDACAFETNGCTTPSGPSQCGLDGANGLYDVTFSGPISCTDTLEITQSGTDLFFGIAFVFVGFGCPDGAGYGVVDIPSGDFDLFANNSNWCPGGILVLEGSIDTTDCASISGTYWCGTVTGPFTASR